MPSALGHRTAHEIGPDIAATYISNGLNQQKTLQSVDSGPSTPVYAGQAFLYDADGNLGRTFVAGDVNDDGSVTQADFDLLYDHFGQTCATSSTVNRGPLAELPRVPCGGLAAAVSFVHS